MRRSLLFVVAGIAAVSAASALADNDPWPVAKARLSYPIYKPVSTLGYKVSSFGYEPQWSPDGTQILFRRSAVLPDLPTM